MIDALNIYQTVQSSTKFNITPLLTIVRDEEFKECPSKYTDVLWSTLLQTFNNCQVITITVQFNQSILLILCIPQ